MFYQFLADCGFLVPAEARLDKVMYCRYTNWYQVIIKPKSVEIRVGLLLLAWISETEIYFHHPSQLPETDLTPTEILYDWST